MTSTFCNAVRGYGLPDGVAAMLSAYVHPAFVLQRKQQPFDDDNLTKPFWHNDAFAEIARLPKCEKEEWRRACHRLVTQALAQSNKPASCTAVCGPWTNVVTFFGAFVVVTASRIPSPSPPAATTPQLPSLVEVVPALPADRPLRDVQQAFRNDCMRYIMGRLILAHPWHTTSLGPISGWTPEFMSSILAMLSMPECGSLWAGEERLAFYNDHYIQHVGDKHPSALGKRVIDVWGFGGNESNMEINHAYAGEPSFFSSRLLFHKRGTKGLDDGVPEETYHTRLSVPMRSNGETFAIINHISDTTTEELTHRRLCTLYDLQHRTTPTRTIDEFYKEATAALAQNSKDLPFVLMYRARPEFKQRRRSSEEDPSHYRLSLVGALGVPEGHPSGPSQVLVRVGDDSTSNATTSMGSAAGEDSVSSARGTTGRSLPSSTGGISASLLGASYEVWPFSDIIGARGEVVSITPLGSRADGFQRRGWDFPCTRAVAFSVGNKDEPTNGIVIFGLNPCRPYDAEFKNFIRMLSGLLNSSLSSVIACETQTKRMEELASLDRAKTTFFSDVSHELRTPLTLILSPLEDVLRETLDPSVRIRLDTVLRNASRLHRLVNSLLDFARIKAGRYISRFVPADLGALTENFASLFRSAIERGKINYVVDCEEGQLVYLDPDSWEKIVTNIISNAFKYCMEGTIQVTVRYTQHEAVFSCSDTGCGIPDGELDNIFARFHRVRCFARSHEGTGIGLSLTNETVKALGGRLSVSSLLGEGSTFTVYLPLGTAHIPPELLDADIEPIRNLPRGIQRYGARMVEEAGEWTANDAVTKRSASSDGTTTSETAFDDERAETVIVLADDNADLRQYCTMLLSPLYTVHAFPDGRSALDYVRRHKVDLILSDIEMPRLDGFAFLSAVKADSTLALSPFILLSARAGSEARVEGLNAGADDYLVKPFSSKELLARVKTHVELGIRRRDLEERVQDRTRLLIEIEAQLRAKVAEEQHMRKQQEIVVDLTSHELRNPLNATWQNAELVEDALDRLRALIPEEGTATLNEAKGAIESIALSVAHQTRIADDILNFSKISMELLTIHPTVFPIFETIQDVCRLWEIETRERNIDLELVAEGDLEVTGVWIRSDPQRISQVTINFLINALRYCPVRHITVAVGFVSRIPSPGRNAYRVAGENLKLDDGTGFWLKIAVRDTGPGLSVEDLKKLFERFAQAHPSKDQFSGGHGLGLFVSRHLVSLLNGFIEVETSKGQGASFSFFVPVERAEADPGGFPAWRNHIMGRSARRGSVVTRPGPRAHESARSEPVLPSEARLQHDTPPPPLPASSDARVPIHVLVVEDNIINRKVLVRQLQGKGFRTSAAIHGQEALDILLYDKSTADSHAPVDVVLMDIEMPVMDGKTAVRALRSWEAEATERRRVPVVAVTGNAREEQILECLSVGFDEVAIKPYRIDDIVRLIGRVLSRTS